MRRRRQPHHQSPSKIPLLISISVIPLLAIINIVLSAQVAHLGFRIADLNQRKADLVSQNETLQEQVYLQASLTKVRTFAQENGYIDTTNLVTLPEPLPVAINQ